MAVPVAVPDVGPAHLHQREELVEDLVEHLLVAPVLDERDAQGGAQLLPVAQHPRLRGARHRVERLRDRDPHPPQPQEADEPVDRVLHDASLLRARSAEVDRAMPVPPEDRASGTDGKQRIRARPITNADNPARAPAEPVRPLPPSGGCDTLTTHWLRA